jgi:hypothetical protein
LVYFVAVWDILWTLGTFFPVLVCLVCFGKLYQEKSGNPAREWGKSYLQCLHGERNRRLAIGGGQIQQRF